jgi:hypothetical protein
MDECDRTVRSTEHPYILDITQMIAPTISIVSSHPLNTNCINLTIHKGGYILALITMWSLLILPWLSLLFLDRSKIRRYMPVALLATVFRTLVNQVGWEYHWWKYKPFFIWDKVIPVYMVYGIFLVGTIWIIAFTLFTTFDKFEKSFFPK